MILNKQKNDIFKKNIKLKFHDANERFIYSEDNIYTRRNKNNMGEVILKTEIPREKGFLYYTSTDSKGNLTVCKAVMSRGRKSKSKGG